jgi:molybdenum-dependent DNA-binding transcriptional regulator ModE
MSYSAFNRNVLSGNFSQEDNYGKKTKCGKSLRGKIMEMVQRGLKTFSAASVEIGVSYRQAERIYKRYRAGGDEALVHGNKGRPSNHKTDKGIIDRALRLYRETYHDFGPTLAAEKMRERDGLDIGGNTGKRPPSQRPRGISTIAEANRFLLESCLPKMNAMFGRPALSAEDAHVSPDGALSPQAGA